tara:strand:+ start:1591 stop:1965 length:375 start_codon:yes stop_codon:yes gene_type:complete
LSTNVHLQAHQSPLRFHTYSPGKIHVNDHIYTKTILCKQDSIILAEAPDMDDVNLDTLKKWQNDFQPELILIGTGAESREPSNIIHTFCCEEQIALDAMSTDYCIRTLIALQNEFRALICLLSP